MEFFTRHILSLIVFSPLAGMLLVAIIPVKNGKLIRWATLLSTLVPLGLTLLLWVQYSPNSSGFQYVETAPWYTALGVSYRVGVDGISLPLLLLTSLLSTLAALASFNIKTNVKLYFLLFLLLETAMLGVFVALDLILFYAFFEFTLIPMMYLIMVWGGENRHHASFKFMIYTMGASLPLLLGFLMLGVVTGSFDLVSVTRIWPTLNQNLFGLSASTVKALAFWAIFLGFAVKVPLWPFHTWLPDAHTEAPTAGSMLLAGVLLKIGGYGFLRILLPLFPEQSARFAPMIAALALAGIVFGALAALHQTDFKRLVAYSSVNHMGLVMLGIATVGAASTRSDLRDAAVMAGNGVVLQMFNHGITSAALFFLVGVIYDRTHTRNLSDYGGLGTVIPVYGGILLFSALSSLGLPGLNGFVGEFLLFRGAWPVFTLVTALSTLGLLLTGAYLLWMVRRVLLGPLNGRWRAIKEIGFREMVTVFPLIVFMVLVGTWPASILMPINETISRLFG